MLCPDGPVDEEFAPVPTKRRLSTSWIVLLCLAGGFLLFWPYQDDRSLWWYRCHLDILDSQLLGLKELLQDYKQRHGRYPMNDEGLAVLDNFESRFALTYYSDRNKWTPQELHGFCGDGVSNFWWLKSKRVLEEFRNQHGRAPQTPEELQETSLGPLRPAGTADDSQELQTTKVELAIDHHDNLFLLDRSGVLTPWRLPYNYENRIGCEANAFRASLADGDRWVSSVQVDNGVTISSSGGFLYDREFSRMWWLRYGPRFLGVLFVVVGAALAVYGSIQTRLTRPLTILALIPGFLIGGSLRVVNSATCYVMSELFSRRTPEMVSLQRDLLEKYRENGVISEETYQRAASTIPSQGEPQ